MRALKICIFIIASYIVLWYPYMISAINGTISGNESDIALTGCFEILANIDSIVDPLICIYLNRDLRKLFQ